MRRQTSANHRRASVLSIQTADGIVFSLRLAGPVTRFLAWLVDLMVIGAVMMLARRLAGVLGVISEDIGGAMLTLIFFVVMMGYSMSMEWLGRGQTIGKKMLRLRVMDQSGFRLQFSQVAIRNLLRAVDFLPAFYMTGGITMLLTRHAQRLGDIAGNTIVVLTSKTVIPDLDQIQSGKYNSFRLYPHIEARLRQNTTPQEATVALQAVLRRASLEPTARVELFQQIATRLRTMAEFPQDAIEGLSDEQYVRNSVEVIFGTKK